MKQTFLLVLSLFLLISSSNVQAQCCAAGNPDSDDNLMQGGGKNVLNISLGYRYSYSDQYFEGSEPIDYTYIEESDFNFSSLSLSYGLTAKWKLTAEVGYFFSKAQTFDFRPNRSAFGLGDGSIMAMYKAYSTKDKDFMIYPMAKVTLPIGKFDQVQDAVVLPIDLQPSSGSFRYNGGVMMIKRFNDSKFSANFIGTAEYSQRIDTDRTYYKYGNLYNLSIAALYKANEKLNLRLQSRYQIRERASGSSGDLINATGGQVLLLAPYLAYKFTPDWNVSAMFEYPIYKNMNGRQLTNEYMVSFKLSRKLNFNKQDTCQITPDQLEKAKEMTFKVKGTCEACKAKIEEICYAQKGILHANWVVETKMLTIKYDERLDIKKLKKLLTKAGHPFLDN